MSDKKHIDRLFQEKLRNFEATPNNTVWNNISTELETHKKKRKVIPLWLRISGIAASLLLLVTIGYNIFSNKNTSNNNTIVNTSNDIEQRNKSNKVNIDKNTELQITTKDVNSNTIVRNEDSNTQNSLDKERNSKNVFTESNQSSTASVSQKANNLETKVNAKNSISVASNDNNIKVKKTITNKKDNSLFNKKNKTLIKENTTISLENAIAKAASKDANNIGKSVLKNVTDSTKTTVNTEDKLSITEELAALEENKEEEETKDQKTKPEDRWSINPNIAPVYFNFLGEGSSIHSQFNSNSKSGEINMSYGIKGAYAINHKLSIRTGINKVDLGYSTNNVYVYNNIFPAAIEEKPIKTIEFVESAENIILISGNDTFFSQIPNELSNQIQGSIDQKLGFIEVPLELEYKLSQRKMGISLVGGFSALFLNQNEIYATLNGNSRHLGKANNINNTSFSANLGIGVDFKLSEKFNFNLEPTFKYQLNTFSETTGNFNPYFIGLYSGLSFKF